MGLLSFNLSKNVHFYRRCAYIPQYQAAISFSKSEIMGAISRIN
jgi:hypothetical protein